VALFFKNSPHTPNGGLSSTVGLKGLLRKFVMIFFVAMGYQLDKIVGTQNMIRDTVAVSAATSLRRTLSLRRW
jgi:hypothetical protein